MKWRTNILAHKNHSFSSYVNKCPKQWKSSYHLSSTKSEKIPIYYLGDFEIHLTYIWIKKNLTKYLICYLFLSKLIIAWWLSFPVH